MGSGGGAAKQFKKEELEALTPTETALPAGFEGACQTFEAEVGGREKLIEHLAHGSFGPREEVLVGAICDPRNDSKSLARICALYGIPFSTLLGLFRDAGFARAQLAAMQRVWKLVPDLAEDVMVRALPHEVLCGICKGTGGIKSVVLEKDPETNLTSKVEKVEECAVCAGKGKVVQQPEREQQKLALQLSGLLPSGGGQPGVQVNVNQRTAVGVRVSAGGMGGDVFSSFQAASDKVLYPEVASRVEAVEAVEAEVVGDPDGEEA